RRAMNNNKFVAIPTVFDPSIPCDIEEPTEEFDKKKFGDFISNRFGVAEKEYAPLNGFLKTFGIESDQILGCGSFSADAKLRKKMLLIERAKLLVMVRTMATENKKWRQLVIPQKDANKSSMQLALNA